MSDDKIDYESYLDYHSLNYEEFEMTASTYQADNFQDTDKGLVAINPDGDIVCVYDEGNVQDFMHWIYINLK